MSLRGKVCLITGATRGIGRSVLERFSSEGARIIGTYERSTALAENLAMDYPCEMHRCDMSKPVEIKALMEHISRTHAQLDVIVNNAGIHEEVSLRKLRKGPLERMFAVNFFGPVWIMRYALTLLSDSSAVVNVASNGGLRGGTSAPHYAASKAALISWTKSTSRLLAPWTRVNAVAPGVIRTEMVEDDTKVECPLGRIGEVHEVSNVIAFLADQAESSYITGQTIVVDGGQYV